MNEAGLRALLEEPRLAKLLAVLNGDGEETRVVGGAVRNSLLGRDTYDIDLATTAEPPLVIARVRKAGFTAIPTGIAHGTVTVLVDGKPFEVTTLRRDIDTDGRHARVAFGRDFAEDARRRDFTMNALSLSPDGSLHDTVEGLADLRARVVRFIGDPGTRIAEDYLRILRLFRFHAAYGAGPLDPAARDAAIAGRAGLVRLSAERLNAELSKLLVAPRAASVVNEMADAGLLGPILGGVPLVSRLARVIAIADRLGQEPDALGRLGALALLVREDALRLRERLRLSNAATRRLEETATLLERHHGDGPPDQTGVDALLFACASREAVADALLSCHADGRAALDDPDWLAAHGHAAAAPVPHLPVSGNDLLARGIAPGRRVGAVLKQLQARWIRAGFPRDPATVTRLLEDVVRDTPG